MSRKQLRKKEPGQATLDQYYSGNGAIRKNTCYLEKQIDEKLASANGTSVPVVSQNQPKQQPAIDDRFCVTVQNGISKTATIKVCEKLPVRNCLYVAHMYLYVEVHLKPHWKLFANIV
jgi:hypothetical protein